MPSFKMPEFWKKLAGESNPTKTITDGATTNKVLDEITDSDKKLQDARDKMEQEYEKSRRELEEAYKKREKVDFENFAEISKINYGIYYVTDTNKKETDIDFLLAHLKAKENIARLDQLPENIRVDIRGEVDEDRKKAVHAIEKEYEQKIKKGLLDAAAYEQATRIMEQEYEKARKLRAENKMTLDRLQAEKEIELAALKKETENAIKAAREEQRLEMVRWIVKALGIIGILQLVGGLLLRSPTFIVSGIFTLGMAYVAAMIPFWVVALSMGVIILVMVIVNPKTGKLHIFKKSEPDQ